MNKEKNFISAVVYVHNGEAHIRNFLNHLMQVLETHFEHCEIICVNDASADDSVRIIKECGSNAKSTALSVLNMSYFHGMEVAMSAGVDLAIGDFILEFDSCRQDYDMLQIMEVYHKSMEGFDIVSASAERKTKFGSAIFYWLYARFTQEHTRMQTESFRILSRRAVNRISGMSKMVPYRKSLYANCGLKTANITYPVVTDVSMKEDNQTKKYRRAMAVDALVIFTDAGYACAKFMTGLMMFISAFMAVYTVSVYINANPVAGWTTTILFLSVAFCGLFAILTVVIKYLQILLNLTFRRKKYSFESIEKLTR